ncbi:MAG: hypothetical protein JO190_10260 [Candidatus Eremiobacteraeota bacterium]|nr:hypothetical protein [Candidatus Eremiobacteraeota bacterium]MBV8499186.1 hypothetical protein [Candidatus Eremiobacteraeota bacterium]
MRRANDALSLASFPLAQRLCDLTGIAAPREALRQVIASAFRGVWPDTRLRDLLLTADLDGRVFRNEAAARLQVSTRHLQRRRAKAVSILAAYVRSLIGERDATVGERGSIPGDPLETIAELVADIEPAVAARILRLGGPRSAERADLLAARASVETGREQPSVAQGAFSPLFATLRAQSKTIDGRAQEAREELWPIFTRAARDRADGSELQFELEWLAFLRARYGGCVREMDRVATNLDRLAQAHPESATRALLAQAEAKLRAGRLRDAGALLGRAERQGLHSLALRQLASSAVLRAEIALQRGDDSAAERFASGAHAILAGRHSDAYRCEATAARAALRLGKAWSASGDATKLSPAAWDRVAIEIERARHLNAAGTPELARARAVQCYEIASTQQYLALAARAAATLGATYDRRSRQRRQWYLRALAHLLTTRDRSVGCDLYPLEAGIALARDLPGALYEGLRHVIPALPPCDDAEAEPACTFLAGASAYALGHADFDDHLIRTIETAARSSVRFCQYLLYFSDDATDVLETAFAAIAGQEQRGGVDQRLANVLRAFAGAVRPRDDVRRFLVG